MQKKITCRTGLCKNIISKDVFDREIALCKQLNSDNDGKSCGWGECAKCGVVPLLIKLHKGVLIEDKEKLKKVRNIIKK